MNIFKDIIEKIFDKRKYNRNFGDNSYNNKDYNGFIGGCFCQSCDTPNCQKAKFCTKCGALLDNAVFCSDCGTKMQQGAKVCSHCGKKSVV